VENSEEGGITPGTSTSTVGVHPSEIVRKGTMQTVRPEEIIKKKKKGLGKKMKIGLERLIKQRRTIRFDLRM